MAFDTLDGVRTGDRATKNITIGKYTKQQKRIKKELVLETRMVGEILVGKSIESGLERTHQAPGCMEPVEHLPNEVVSLNGQGIERTRNCSWEWEWDRRAGVAGQTTTITTSMHLMPLFA